MKEEYIAHRCNYEGEKLRPVLEFLSSKEYKEMRKTSFISNLSKFINIEKIESLVDYGGDTGELIPEELYHAKLYVVDIESRVYDDKVIAIQDPSECGVVNLVFCGHTLEHVSDPNSLVADMKRYLKSGGWIYIEIPRGRDYSPGYYFHEHINHFNITSLKCLLEQNGFTNLSGITIEYEKHIGTAYAVVGQLK
jgi:SAM-dependent methyltransferase